MNLLFVIQRFGNNVDGGAELYCKWLAEHLKKDFKIDILTTCAKSYITWENEFPSGEDKYNGLSVFRCKVDRKRDIKKFNQLTEKLLNNRHSQVDEEKWLEEQGPVSSELLEFIKLHGPQYHYIVFFTYLYHPTVEGIKIYPQKSLLVPTAHNEPVAHFRIFKELYRAAKGLLFLTKSEQSFVNTAYNIKDKPQLLLGSGVTIPFSNLSSFDFMNKYSINIPYILYIGRVDKGKGCGELIHYFKDFKLLTNNDVSLVLAGRNHMGFAEESDIKFPGFLPDEYIKPAIESSTLVVVPSRFESLSILLLQSFLIGKPAIVNGESSVLKEHCIDSNAGLFYLSKQEFIYELKLLLSKPDLCRVLGENGKRYIQSKFTWDIVVKKFKDFIKSI